jgi:large subunit ribosomal protein L18
MAKQSERRRLWLRRKKKTRKQLERADRPLLTCFRSTKHIYAQIVDPDSGETLAGVSTRSPAIRGAVATGGNRQAAQAVGREIARLALEKNIAAVTFNRNGFIFHGRVKAMAEAAREAGLSL